MKKIKLHKDIKEECDHCQINNEKSISELIDTN